MTAKIKLNAASGGGSVSIVAPTSTTSNANVELKLPIADGSSEQVIKTDGSGNLSFGQAVTAKNLAINGAMNVAQYGASTSNIDTSGYYAVDRMKLSTYVGSERYTVSQETDAPTGSGFNKSFKIKTTTADTSANTGTYAHFSYNIEGQDLQQLLKGTSSSKPLTVSFWVKGNTNYTPVAELKDTTNTRINVQTFNVTTSWTKVVLTYVGDTTGGTIDNDNTVGLQFNIWLKASAFYSGGTSPTQNTWVAQSNQNIRAALLTFDIAASTDNYFQITGLQIEVGSTASSFAYETFADTLRKCQRYLYKLEVGSGGGNTNNNFIVMSRYSTGGASIPFGTVPFPVQMRTEPTFSFVGTSQSSAGYAGDPVAYSQSKDMATIKGTNTVAAGGVLYCRVGSGGSDTLDLLFSAEL